MRAALRGTPHRTDRPVRWERHGLRRGALAVVAALVGPVLLTVGQAATAQALSVSAVGNEAPVAFAVSPLYARTHMVAAVTVPLGGCNNQCIHLWITRDGGGSWQRVSTPPPGAHIVVVARPDGGEAIVAEAAQNLAASKDDGKTWLAVGPVGTPTLAAGRAEDTVLVAGHGQGGDYLLSGATQRNVAGSSGADVDLAFADFSETAGIWPPALLAARDRNSGLPMTLVCDAGLTCDGARMLPGAQPDATRDMSVFASDDHAQSGVVYVRTTRSLYRSMDGGHSFVPLAPPGQLAGAYVTIPGAAAGAGVSPGVYAAVLSVAQGGSSQITGGGVYVSHDHGTTWAAVGSPGPLDGGASGVVVAPDGRIFAGYVNGHGDAGLVCSADGTSWQATCASEGGTCAAACPGGAAAPGAAAASTRQGGRVAAGAGSNLSASQAAPATTAALPAPSVLSAPGGERTLIASGVNPLIPALLFGVPLVLLGLSMLLQRRRRQT